MDDGGTILVDLVNTYKNWYQNKKGCQSRINSHPQIEKLANINIEKVINKDKTLPKFVQASARILYTPPLKILENNICCGMLPHSFKIATVSSIDRWDKVFKNGPKKFVEDSL